MLRQAIVRLSILNGLLLVAINGVQTGYQRGIFLFTGHSQNLVTVEIRWLPIYQVHVLKHNAPANFPSSSKPR